MIIVCDRENGRAILDSEGGSALTYLDGLPVNQKNGGLIAVVSGLTLCPCTPLGGVPGSSYARPVGAELNRTFLLPRAGSCAWRLQGSDLTLWNYNDGNCSTGGYCISAGYDFFVRITSNKCLYVHIAFNSGAYQARLFEAYSSEVCFPITVQNTISACQYVNPNNPTGDFATGGAITLSLDTRPEKQCA